MTRYVVFLILYSSVGLKGNLVVVDEVFSFMLNLSDTLKGFRVFVIYEVNKKIMMLCCYIVV